MATISVRNPYYVAQNATSLKVEVRVWNNDETEPVDWPHSFEKTSYETGVAEDLRINIAPVIRPYFTHIPLISPAPGDLVHVDEIQNIKIRINESTEETYTAVFGYVAPVSADYFDHWQTTKRVHHDTDAYITLPAASGTATYTTNDGQIHNEVLTAKTRYQVIPVNHPSIDLTASKSLSIAINGITYNFEIVCPYQDGTISFINSVGMWESFDVNGRQDYSWKTQRQEYIQYSTGFKRSFNANGLRSVRANTGWVDNDFRRVIEELLLSEMIIWNYGSQYEILVLTSENLKRQVTRADKMLNYTLAFDFGSPMIEIDSGSGLPAAYSIYNNL